MLITHSLCQQLHGNLSCALCHSFSQVVEDFDPEKNGIKANLVSFEMYWFVVQHIQNPKKSLLGKIFYDELTFGKLS